MDLLVIFIASLLMVPLALFTAGPVRIVLGIFFVLIFPGYTFLAALFPRKTGLDSLMRLALVLDDSVVAGDYHFPCVIYMRERGNAIGKTSPLMRKERAKWFEEHNCFEDAICKKNCLDVCIEYNNKYADLHRTI